MCKFEITCKTLPVSVRAGGCCKKRYPAETRNPKFPTKSRLPITYLLVAILCAKFQNEWVTEIDIMDDRVFAKFEIKMNFGWISCFATCPRFRQMFVILLKISLITSLANELLVASRFDFCQLVLNNAGRTNPLSSTVWTMTFNVLFYQ